MPDKTDKTDEPRFSEEEFALILRRAIELDVGSSVVRPTPPPKMPPGGLTLSEIKEIAVEVGISPSRIREAVDSLGTPEWGPLARIFGGPPRLLVERSIGRRLTPEEMARILDSVREAMKAQGESHEVLGGVEWRKDSKLARLVVRVSPEAGGTKVTASVDRGGAAFLSHYIPMAVGLGVAGITVGNLEPLAGQAIVGMVAAGAGVGYGVARTLWVTATRRWRRLLDRITAGALEEAGAPLELPGAADEPNGIGDDLRGADDEPFSM